ncbi:MAG TPA: DUF4282 domain-containing protein [Acidobacteriota bacterium]|nr:DUF4282 domain-containing protein [Acidobacteriota bacterium]
MQEQEKSFFSKLFDFSFREFVTPTVVGIVYGIMVVLAMIAALGFIVTGFGIKWYVGLLFLIVSPVVFLFLVILARLYLEIVVAMVRIAQNTTNMIKDSRP